MKNQARCSPLSGRVNLHRYENEFEVSELVGKDTFHEAYEARWGHAPWMSEGSGKDGDVIVLDITPPSSVPSTSTRTSRQATFESER
jgi:hypothetical protein